MNELKKTFRRIAAMILTLLMILTLVPGLWGVEAMAATSGALTGLSDLTIGLSYSGTGDNAWTAEGNSIAGSVTSTLGCSKTDYFSTLTLTNQKTSTATLKFAYSVQMGGGSIKIDGTAVTQNGSFSK